MKPLYVKKNGVVYKISGNGMPASYPAENVEYDNTVTSELQATDVQGAIDELSTRQGGVQSDWDEDDTTELDYIKNKPQNLVQDASYVHTDNNYNDTDKGKVNALGTASTKDVGVANGVAELDAAGKVPSSQLPSFVDDVIEVADYDHLPITGESGKIYVTLNTNKTYRWTGSGYAEISESLALGETSSTAYRGDRGKTAYDHATETKLSTATASGLYKVAATAQGHISSLTAVEKSDITALGIPGQDTNTKNTAYGTCSTAGNVKDKVATLSNATNWVLEVGTIVGVRFTYTNTHTPSSGNAVTLNVNNTGAKNIRYGDGIGTGTGDIKNPTAYGEAGQTIYYMYDGTYWVWVSHSKDNDTLYNFVGREFRSCNFNDAGLATGFGGDANLMVVNGVYYYSSNGPSTSIGASANDGSVFVHVCDDGYVVQIAQNYETGNIFVRGMNDNVWGAWKKPIANITGNNTVLTTDKTPFLTRQTLNPTGFSGYVREKLIGASYAWNQLNDQTYYRTSANTTVTANAKNGFDASSTAQYIQPQVIYGGGGLAPVYAGHKYLIAFGIEDISHISSGQLIAYGTSLTRLYYAPQKQNHLLIAPSVNGNQQFGFEMQFTMDAANRSIVVTNLICIDLTLAFGSTIADHLYSLTNNGGITKLRDMGFPIDKYTPYGYGLYSVKTSGKKIVGKNLIDIDTCNVTGAGWAFYKIEEYYFPMSTYAFSFDLSGSSSQQVQVQISKGTKIVGSKVFNISNGHCSTSFETSAIGDGIRFYVNGAGIFSNIQLELGSSATTYEPYSSITYPLGNDELRGKFDLVDGEIVASGDVKESNGEIDRVYKVADLGSFNWTYDSQSVRFYSNAIQDIGGEMYSGNNYYKNVMFSCYNKQVNNDNMGAFIYANRLIYVYDNRYTDAATFKTAITGQKVQYELATPTTEQSTPFADPMSLVGATTEEYIDTRDIPCPVGAERQYMGQSEDVVEIPSSPLSDGKRKLVAETSGGKTQYYWEGEGIAPVRKISINIKDYTTENNAFTCPCDGYIFVRLPSGSGHVLMRLMDSLGNVVGTYTDAADAEEAKAYSVFVKKGTKTYAYSYVGETLNYTYWFYGIA